MLSSKRHVAHPTALVLFIICTLVNPQIIRRGQIIPCIGINSCRNNTIICDPFNDCAITCQGINACDGTVISCPNSGACLIQCQTSQSCSNSIINATYSASLIVSCSSQALSSCDMTTMYCPDNGHSGPIQCTLQGATSTSIPNGFRVCCSP